MSELKQKPSNTEKVKNVLKDVIKALSYDESEPYGLSMTECVELLEGCVILLKSDDPKFMWKCPFCQRGIVEEAYDIYECPYCGAKQNTVFPKWDE